MEKRVVFQNRWLPYLLVAPQLAITLIFFFLPAGQAIYQSVLMQDPFGLSTEFVGLQNFETLLSDPNYVSSFKITMVFSALVAFLGLAISLLLAVCADRVLRGASAYKTFLIVPYAVAPAVAGVLWMFIFNPTLGVLSYVMRMFGIDWNYLVDADQALTLLVIAAVWKQVSYNFIFFLAGLQAIPKSLLEAAAMDGADGGLPAAVAHDLLPARDEHRLRVLRHVRHRRCDDHGRSGAGYEHSRLQGVRRRLPQHGLRRLRRTVRHPDGDGDHPHGDPVPLHRAARQLLTGDDRWLKIVPGSISSRT